MPLQLKKQLFYQFHGERRILPDWAEFFLQLGWAVTRFTNADSFLHVVLSVPTRILAAPFVASGLVLGRASVPVTTQDTLAHFQFLSTLPPGTNLSFLRPGSQRRIIGSLESVEGADGNIRLRIRVNNAIFERPASSAGMIFVAPEDAKQTGMSGRKIVADGIADLMHFLEPEAYQSFMFQSRLDCVLMGVKNTLEDEVRHSSFYASKDGNAFRLSDLLRIKSFSSTYSSFRSDIASPNPYELKTHEDQPYAVILDGTLALRKAANRYQNCHRVVVLERASTNLDESVSFVQQEYIKQRTDANPTTWLPSPPDGIEMLAYEVEA